MSQYKDNLPKNVQEYLSCYMQLAALIDRAMDSAESTTFISEQDRVKSLNRIAETVETISCLRGDTSIFNTGRPDGLNEYQSQLYAVEDSLRSRLQSLGYTYTER